MIVTRVKVLRQFYVNRRLFPVGEVIEFEDQVFAAELLAAKKAELSSENVTAARVGREMTALSVAETVGHQRSAPRGENWVTGTK